MKIVMSQKMINILKLVIVFILLTATASADQKKIEPLSSELLDEPVYLECGLTIREWRGNKELNTESLNALCNLATVSFPQFLKTKKLKKDHALPFVWHGSFIPDGECNRCLNDMKNRFSTREIKEKLSGWTYHQRGYIFVGINRKDFDTVFIHELFHALSSYYGVFVSNQVDEVWAREFTMWLGFGV